MKIVISSVLIGLLFMGPFLHAGRTRIIVGKVSTVGWHLIETGLGLICLSGLYMEFSPLQPKYCYEPDATNKVDYLNYSRKLTKTRGWKKWGKDVGGDERAILLVLAAISFLNSGIRGLERDLKITDRIKKWLVISKKEDRACDTLHDTNTS